jgi:hypothetical protein
MELFMIYDELIIEATAKWNNIYEYPCDTDDLDHKFLMSVVCPVHGEIKIYPKEHLNIGCWKFNK